MKCVMATGRLDQDDQQGPSPSAVKEPSSRAPHILNCRGSRSRFGWGREDAGNLENGICLLADLLRADLLTADLLTAERRGMGWVARSKCQKDWNEARQSGETGDRRSEENEETVFFGRILALGKWSGPGTAAGRGAMTQNVCVGKYGRYGTLGWARHNRSPGFLQGSFFSTLAQ